MRNHRRLMTLAAALCLAATCDVFAADTAMDCIVDGPSSRLRILIQEDHGRQALEQLEQAPQACRNELRAAAWFSIARSAFLQNRYPTANTAYYNAFNYWGRNNGLPTQRPELRSTVRDLSLELTRYGLVKERLGQKEEAAQAYRDALANLERIRAMPGTLFAMTPETNPEAIRENANRGLARVTAVARAR
jgi:tetratricopeptide (TPR) repeat protein